MWKCKDLMKMTDAVKPAKTGANVEVQITVTNIVKCMSTLPGITIVDYFCLEKLCRMQKKRKNERG